MDKLSPEQRHDNMAAIGSKNTKPEMIVRRGLWSRGFRYRLNHKRLPGHPDLVLLKYRTCIFVNGCFWHGHDVLLTNDNLQLIKNSDCCKIPNKIRRNQERDIATQHQLAVMGWHCIIVWECQLKPKVREQTLQSLAYTLNKIWLEDHRVTVKPYANLEEEHETSIAAEWHD